MINKGFIKDKLPAFFKRFLFRKGLIADFKPRPGKLLWGDLARKTPLSIEFGYDRGGPVDRYYIQNFLYNNQQWIKGNVLEIGEDIYTRKFGKDRVRHSDVLHIVEGNPVATYVGDLSGENSLPSDYFDCIILTQTLHLIYDYTRALQTCNRILKKGGCLLMTVPGITPMDSGEWNKYWFWSFTPHSINRILDEVLPDASKEVQAFGNVQAATAFLYGLGQPEIDQNTLDFFDPSYVVIITACVIK